MMKYCFFLLLNLLLGPRVQGIQEGRRGVLVLTETGDCEGCDEKDGGEGGEGGEGRVQCVPRVQSPSLAVEWTVQRIQLLSLSKQEIDFKIINTCGDLNIGKWRLLHALSNYTHTSNLHIFLASTLNPLLQPSVSNLGLEFSKVEYVSPHSTLTTLSRLVRQMGWKQVVVLSSPGEGMDIGGSLLGEDICVTRTLRLPSLDDPKDTFSRITESFRSNEVKNVLLSGFGAEISRFMRNLQELNLRVGVLALPWDGPLSTLVGEQMINSTIISLLPKNSVMPEFTKFYKKFEEISGDVYDNPLSWQLVKALYGVLVLNDSTIDDTTARDGLELSRDGLEYTVEEFNPEKRVWEKLGVYEEGEFSWPRSYQVQDACTTCICENGLWKDGAKWRWESWVTALATLAGLGILCSLAIFVFLCAQCGEVLEGAQSTSFLLLSATVLTFASMLPYCFQPGNLTCILRTLAPAGSLTFLVSILLSRSLLLATSDTAGLPGHASGCLQVILLLLMLGVEVSILGLDSWHLRGNYLNLETCHHRSWGWLGMMAWPGLLLLVQTFLSPGIWRSRRNYKEGVLFSLSSVAVTIVSAAWVTVYILCAELYGAEWEDISVCAGLVSTGTVILLVIFIPKVYLMTVWGSGGHELSLQLPGTTTSTLHTDTLDYIPNNSIYKTPIDENTVAYVNLRSRESSKPSSVHYGSAYIMGTRNLMDSKQNLTYQLDRNTEPADNISWEPFNSNSNYMSHPTLPISQPAGIPSTRL